MFILLNLNISPLDWNGHRKSFYIMKSCLLTLLPNSKYIQIVLKHWHRLIFYGFSGIVGTRFTDSELIVIAKI